MPEISCYYVHYRLASEYITFITYENYIIVRINEYKMITLSNETFMKITRLFDFYILSLILVEDAQQFYKIDDNYCLMTIYLWERLYLTKDYRYVYIHHKNLLNKRQPKRETSNKKIKKFIKFFNNLFENDEPITLIEKYLNAIITPAENELNEGLHKNNTIQLLTGIKKKYSEDIYDQIRKYV